MRRNIKPHHKCRDRPDLWLPTSLQPSLVGQGAGAKPINHKQTIHVGRTQLRCSKNEKKTHLQTDSRLRVIPSITGSRLHEVRKGKTHKAIILSMALNNAETFLSSSKELRSTTQTFLMCLFLWISPQGHCPK